MAKLPNFGRLVLRRCSQPREGRLRFGNIGSAQPRRTDAEVESARRRPRFRAGPSGAAGSGGAGTGVSAVGLQEPRNAGDVVGALRDGRAEVPGLQMRITTAKLSKRILRESKYQAKRAKKWER